MVLIDKLIDMIVRQRKRQVVNSVARVTNRQIDGERNKRK